MSIGEIITNPSLSRLPEQLSGAGNYTFEEPEATGPYCVQTKRVVVISPFPNRLNRLIMELSVQCWDVLVFRRLDPSLVKQVPVDLIMVDLTALDGSEVDSVCETVLHLEPLRTVFLAEESRTADEALARIGEVLVWPVRSGVELQRLVDRAMRAADAAPAAPAKLTFKDVTVDIKKMAVHVGNARIDLTKTEYEMLVQLMMSDGSVLSREELLNRIWGSQFFGGSNIVDVHVKSLRKKLGDAASAPKYIVTVRGVGYRLADD